MSGFASLQKLGMAKNRWVGDGARLARHRRMALSRLQLSIVFAFVGVGLLHTSAWADDPYPPPAPPSQPPAPPYQVPPPPPPGTYPIQPGQRPQYVAPLSQETQSSYVPQSVALSGPKLIEPLDDLRPPPDGYTEVQRRRKGMLIGGSITFGVSYGIALLVAAAGDDDARYNGGHNEFAAMWVPVLGPLLQIGNTETSEGKVVLLGMGGAEALGATMLFVGLTSTKRMFLRNDLVGSLHVAPMAGHGSSGVVLSGQF
jgi:hypothetical protein